ncbi:MAG: sialidase family protein, partial [Bacteroidota bacterium]
MKKILFTFSLVVLFAGSILWRSSNSPAPLPAPTDGTIVKENAEEEGNQNLREAWFERMHRTAPEDDWRQLEYQNQMDRHLERRAARNPFSGQESGIEILADGYLEGEWKERGSKNQAGSVFETLYDEINDQVYLISAGGSLWKSPRDGSNWQVVNQDLRFDNGLLRYLQMDNHRRMIALIRQFPHYSDDDGLTWTPAEGIPVADSWARSTWIQIMEDDQQSIFLLSRPDFWTPFKVYHSTDQGETFNAVVNLPGDDQDRYALCKPYQSDELYLIEKIMSSFTGIYRINPVTYEVDTLIVDNQMAFKSGRANLYASQLDENLIRFYAYNGDGELHQSEDYGTTWTFQGNIPERPWDVGLYLSPSDPNFLLTGGLECHKSYDGGITWETMNAWGEYYDDIVNKLHADLMHFQEFTTPVGETFTLVSNHGGLSASYDQMATVKNIALSGLNVSQYYDVRTDPIWPFLFYAGSQDQGFQRGWSQDMEEIIDMEQVISGDYGHIVFSGNGSHLWTVYPGGWITFYDHPFESGHTASWEVESNNESVWIPPLMESPDPSEDVVYLAGGAVDGGSGSYLIELTYDLNSNSILPQQMPFNFMANSAGGQLSAMKTAPLTPNYWYAATTNGRFFYSGDAGASWSQTLNVVPEGPFLYGQTILPSTTHEGVVYYGGSGYY